MRAIVLKVGQKVLRNVEDPSDKTMQEDLGKSQSLRTRFDLSLAALLLGGTLAVTLAESAAECSEQLTDSIFGCTLEDCCFSPVSIR